MPMGTLFPSLQHRAQMFRVISGIAALQVLDAASG